jgi:glutathione synthase/RimK-type ligase-like ATP-grasp enzyme
MQSIVVVNKPKDWNLHIPDVEVISARAYLTDSKYSEMSNARIYNLCQSYRYQGLGYYVSLLAEARGHRSIPNITTIQDLKSQSIIRIISDELDQLIQRSFSRLKSTHFVLNIYFGKHPSKQYENLSKQLYNLFQAPLLRTNFVYEDEKWQLQNISPLPIHQIPEHHKAFVLDSAYVYFAKKRIRSLNVAKSTYDLAILLNPDEKAPPSDKKAIKNFIEAAEEEGIRAKIITKNDYSRIPEFDALFIRETTAVNHHTYRFARRALAENIIVVDDPASIVKCTNKVYTAELFKKANIPIPKTLIIHKGNKDELIRTLGLPCVLKQPDGSFSKGVVKVSDPVALEDELEHFFSQSDLIIAQEYAPTDFDWRIGILDKQAIYACKYYMAKDHWQIYDWHPGRRMKDGAHETIPIEKAPAKIVKIAQRAASLIGDGFYGVDIKQSGSKVMVIEVNDNPSIEAGVEDFILKDELYAKVMKYFVRRIKRMKKE